MRHYGVEMRGGFIGEILSTAPAWTSDDKGRLIYAQDTNIYYYGSNTEWIEITGGNGAGSSLPLVLPNYCSLDDTDDDISRGNAFNMVETINFNDLSNGAIWFTFQFPASFDGSKDINMILYYNLSGSDDSKIVTWQTKYWVYGDTTTPNPASPTGTNSDDINTGLSQDGKRQSKILSTIPNVSLTSGHTISLKFTRLVSLDTYTGTLQMIYVYMYQIA